MQAHKVMRRRSFHIFYAIDSQMTVMLYYNHIQEQTHDTMPATGHGGPYGSETSMFPHFLNNRRTDDGEISIARRPAVLYLRKIPSRHFCDFLSRTQAHNAAGRSRSVEKSSDLMGNVTHDIPACGIVLELAALKRFSCR
jgi:hypothetical protein